MRFFGIVTLARALLQREGRITYRALKRGFELDDASLEDLRRELIFRRLARRAVAGWQDDPRAGRPDAERGRPCRSALEQGMEWRHAVSLGLDTCRRTEKGGSQGGKQRTNRGVHSRLRCGTIACALPIRMPCKSVHFLHGMWR
jgi:hypothetical protein